MTVLRGVHPLLEDEADRILAEHFAGIRRFSDKSDVLTKTKMKRRVAREVLVPSGTPDPSTRSGIFHRTVNRDRHYLNSREGKVQGRRDMAEHRDGPGGIGDYFDG